MNYDFTQGINVGLRDTITMKLVAVEPQKDSVDLKPPHSVDSLL